VSVSIRFHDSKLCDADFSSRAGIFLRRKDRRAMNARNVPYRNVHEVIAKLFATAAK